MPGTLEATNKHNTLLTNDLEIRKLKCLALHFHDMLPKDNKSRHKHNKLTRGLGELQDRESESICSYDGLTGLGPVRTMTQNHDPEP